MDLMLIIMQTDAQWWDSEFRDLLYMHFVAKRQIS